MTDVSIHIDAAPDRVWRELTAVPQWPEWTASVTRVEPLDAELAVGQRVRIEQPKLPVGVWRVTELDPGRSFTWQTSIWGVTTTGTHRVEPNAAGGCDLSLAIGHAGPLAFLGRARYGKRTRHSMDMEANGLKRRSES
ncbi:MAG TPA: SRPBCC family protein [Acidimicrobiia bacterium]|jgi:uncharacterized protein YndB with AHSA1/START domain